MAQLNQSYFDLRQTRELAAAFLKYDVKFLFIGKGGAIILGYPGETQDVNLFPKKGRENAEGILKGLNDISFSRYRKYCAGHPQRKRLCTDKKRPI